jgi:hypothetical protein
MKIKEIVDIILSDYEKSQKYNTIQNLRKVVNIPKFFQYTFFY